MAEGGEYGLVGRAGGQRLPQLGQPLGVVGEEGVFLGGEIPEEGPPRYARLGGDVVDGDGVVALLGEQPQGGVLQVGGRTLPVALPQPFPARHAGCPPHGLRP